MEIVIKNEKESTQFKNGDLFRWNSDKTRIIQIVQVNMFEHMFIELNSADRWDDDKFQLSAIPKGKLSELTFIGNAKSITIDLR